MCVESGRHPIVSILESLGKRIENERISSNRIYSREKKKRRKRYHYDFPCFRRRYHPPYTPPMHILQETTTNETGPLSHSLFDQETTDHAR